MTHARTFDAATTEPSVARAPTSSAHGFTRGQRVQIRDGYEFTNPVRTGEVVTQMPGIQPAWAVRCEFDGGVYYLRPDGIELAPSPTTVPQQEGTRTFAVPPATDPIHAAIERHRAAYDAFQVAPEGEAALVANDDYDAATEALVSTACATRFGALALLGHLCWWLADEAEFKAGHQPGYGIAEARVADLTLFLGTHLPPAVIPQRIPLAAPSGRLGMPATCALDPRRAARVLMLTGEAMAAVAIISGGIVLTGLATLL